MEPTSHSSEMASLLNKIRQLQTQMQELKTASGSRIPADRVMGAADQHRAPDDLDEDGDGEDWYEEEEPATWEAVMTRSFLKPSVPAGAHLCTMMHSPPRN